ncbi:MAG: VanZ family protein [Bacillota bacterium]
MKSRVQSILIFMLIVTLGFIWGNSIGSAPKSHSESQKALEYVRPILEPVVGADNFTDHLVRKIAHFVEFGALGGELAALLVVRRRVRLQGIANCLFAGLSVAVIDETIQIFSDRGPLVQDAWLDFAGVCAGIALILLINWLAVQLVRGRVLRRDSATASGASRR